MIELDSNAKENIDFYKYLSNRVTDIKIDAYEKIFKNDKSLDLRDVITILESLERTIDNLFGAYAYSWNGKNRISSIYDEIIKLINERLDGTTDLGDASLHLAKHIVSDIYEEWQESRKDDSNGKW